MTKKKPKEVQKTKITDIIEKKKKEYTVQELEILIENHKESKENILNYFSSLGEKCKNTDHSFIFFNDHLVAEEDFDIKKLIVSILIDKFSSRKKDLQRLFDHLFTQDSHILLFKQILDDIDDHDNFLEFINHPILRLYIRNLPFLKENHYSLSNELFFLRSQRKDIQFGEYIYFKGYFEGKSLILRMKGKLLLKKIKESKQILIFDSYRLPKKKLNLVIILLNSILDFQDDSLDFSVIEANVEPDEHQGYISYDLGENDFEYHNPRWFAIIDKKKDLCALILLEFRDINYSQCEVCHRTFVHQFSKKYDHICFQCWYKRNKNLTYFEATDLHHYGSYRKYLKIVLKSLGYKKKLKEFEQLLKEGSDRKKIREFYLNFKKYYEEEKKIKKQKKEIIKYKR